MVILAAPSGAGKTTVAKRLFSRLPRLAFSVSHTTRPPRPREVDGKSYYFVDDATFDAMVAEGAFAEWAHVHKRRYGTSHAEIARLRGAGRHILFDVDVQGAEQLLEAYPDAISVFMVTPTMEELERRLRGRGTESEEQIRVRLETARNEISRSGIFRYLVVNDHSERTAADLHAIIRAEGCARQMHEELVEALLEEGIS